MFFRKKNTQTPNKTAQVSMKALDYPPKIILGWAKAIEGNTELLEWFSKNGFEELTIACWAIHLKDDARTWLMKNGFPHLMAFIHASEGNESALEWLKINRMELLYNMALAIDGENENLIWIRQHATPDIFILTQAIKRVKDQIEENHNNFHSFGKDY